MATLAILTYSTGILQAVQITAGSSTNWQSAPGGAWAGARQFTTVPPDFTECGAGLDYLGLPLIFATKPVADLTSPTVYILGFERAPTATPAIAQLPISPHSPIWDLAVVRLPDGRNALFCTGADGNFNHLSTNAETAPGALDFPEWTVFQPGQLVNSNGARGLAMPNGPLQLWSLDTNGAIIHSLYTAPNWSPWQSVPATGPHGGPAPVLDRIGAALGRPTTAEIMGHTIDVSYPVFLYATDASGGLWASQAAIAPNGDPSSSKPEWRKLTPQHKGDKALHLNVIQSPTVDGAAEIFVWFQGNSGAALRTKAQTYASATSLTPIWPAAWKTIAT